MALSRDVLGHRGYSLRAQRLDLNFDPDTRFRFFDFRATSVEAEYREPVRPNLSVLATVRAETADHFCRNVTTLGDLCPEVGVPFRTERSGILMVGVRRRAAGGPAVLLQGSGGTSVAMPPRCGRTRTSWATGT